MAPSIKPIRGEARTLARLQFGQTGSRAARTNAAVIIATKDSTLGTTRTSRTR